MAGEAFERIAQDDQLDEIIEARFERLPGKTVTGDEAWRCNRRARLQVHPKARVEQAAVRRIEAGKRLADAGAAGLHDVDDKNVRQSRTAADCGQDAGHSQHSFPLIVLGRVRLAGAKKPEVANYWAAFAGIIPGVYIPVTQM